MRANSFALIMAGGQGTRFWPWSTDDRPKQFLPIIGDQPLIAQTWKRLRRLIPEENIYVVADRRYLPAVRECLPTFEESNFISEPSPRNTAPCLMMANIVLSEKNRNATLLVTPADHHIANEGLFAEQMAAALEAAQSRCLVTAGIPPTSAHTGYGYIQVKPRHKVTVGGHDFFTVAAFREKPDRATAKRYLRTGRFFWNSGMFVYRLDNFRSFLETYAPDYFGKYLEMERLQPGSDPFNVLFNTIRPDSIDYVLMERLRETRMVRAQFDWNDVGSWSSLYEAGTKDVSGNVARGNIVLIESRDSLAFTTITKPIALVGLKNVAVIETESGVLVAEMGSLQRVKVALNELRSKGLIKTK